MSSRQNTNLARSLTERAYADIKSGDCGLAVRHATEALGHDPNYVDAYVCRSNAFALIGDDGRAIEDCTQAIRIEPNNAVAYHNRGCALRGQGNLKQSLLDYNRTIELDSTNDKSFAQRASVYLMLHKYETCIEDANSALNLNPDFRAALLYRACAYANLRQFDSAIEDFNSLIDSDADISSCFLRAMCFIEGGMYKEALDDAQCIEDFLGRANGLSEHCRGCVYQATGELDKALEAFSRACNDLAAFRPAFEKRAALYEQVGELDLAKKDLEAANKLELRPPFNVNFERAKTVLL